jgi:hypothetical protein
MPLLQVSNKGIGMTGYTVRFAGIAQVLYTDVVKAIRKAARITACQSHFLQCGKQEIGPLLRGDYDAVSASRAR